MKRKSLKRSIIEAVVAVILFAVTMLVIPDNSTPDDFALTAKQKAEVVARWSDR